MSNKIDPEAARPMTRLDFDLSDRNPAVVSWGGEGGLVESPSAAEGRVTPAGPAVSPNAGMKF